MGLAIVQDMVNIYHGVIRYKSEVGKGTVFTVYFPAMEEQRERATLIPFPRGGYEKILVVDDEEIILDVTADFFTSTGTRFLGLPVERRPMRFIMRIKT